MRSPGAPALSVIVSTIGRPADLERLLDSLVAAEDAPSFELIVVDQSRDGCCLSLLAGRSWPFPVTGLTSGRGATLGRNAGASAARGEILTFPDDNAWYLPSSLSDAIRLMDPALDLLSGMQVTSAGEPSMLRWLPGPAVITPRNVQRAAIESGVFVRTPAFRRVGGFDERIGVGSPGPFQAGEVTDLLLRLLRSGGTARFDPTLRVVSEDPREQPDALFGAKMRGYGRGIGHLYRLHRLPMGQLAYFCTRKIVAAPVRSLRGRADLGRADLQWVLGVIEGVRSSESL